jgi:hypothetical protein
MRVWICVLLALLVCGSAAASPRTPLVVIENNSLVVPQAQVDAVAAASQVMVARDLGPVWHVQATISGDQKLTGQADYLLILDDNDPFGCGCLGFHDTFLSAPFATVYIKPSIKYHEAWPLVATHELEEMLVDPNIDQIRWWDNRRWLVEVSDPVESGFFAYWINGIPVSDFITPNWYGGPPPYDFTNHFTHPGQLGRHGYAAWQDDAAIWHLSFNY